LNLITKKRVEDLTDQSETPFPKKQKIGKKENLKFKNKATPVSLKLFFVKDMLFDWHNFKNYLRKKLLAFLNLRKF
jgi:hypothetical protein